MVLFTNCGWPVGQTKHPRSPTCQSHTLGVTALSPAVAQRCLRCHHQQALCQYAQTHSETQHKCCGRIVLCCLRCDPPVATPLLLQYWVQHDRSPATGSSPVLVTKLSATMLHDHKPCRGPAADMLLLRGAVVRRGCPLESTEAGAKPGLVRLEPITTFVCAIGC